MRPVPSPGVPRTYLTCPYTGTVIGDRSYVDRILVRSPLASVQIAFISFGVRPKISERERVVDNCEIDEICVDKTLYQMPINFRYQPPATGEINVNPWRAPYYAPPQIGPKNG
jgi:hypothetical protein